MRHAVILHYFFFAIDLHKQWRPLINKVISLSLTFASADVPCLRSAHISVASAMVDWWQWIITPREQIHAAIRSTWPKEVLMRSGFDPSKPLAADTEPDPCVVAGVRQRTSGHAQQLSHQSTLTLWNPGCGGGLALTWGNIWKQTQLWRSVRPIYNTTRQEINVWIAS